MDRIEEPENPDVVPQDAGTSGCMLRFCLTAGGPCFINMSPPSCFLDLP